MNQLFRYILFILFLIGAFYYAWSEGDRRVGEREYLEVLVMIIAVEISLQCKPL